MNLTKW